jgi:thiamine-phosphate pyrophosphorylase
LPPLLFFTEPARTPDPASTALQLPRGSAVVFRAFGAPDALRRGLALRDVVRGRGVLLLVGADSALAARLRADGVHLPERLADRTGVIGALKRRFLVTAAAHSAPAVIRARRGGVDAVVVSPVFASASASAGRPMGARAFIRLVREARLPVYALGGVDAHSARALTHSDAAGVAGVEAMMRAFAAPLRT